MAIKELNDPVAAVYNHTTHFPFPSNTHWFLVNVPTPLRCHDDGGGVGLTKWHLSMGQSSTAEGPGCVDICSPDPLQLRDPLPYIIPLRQTDMHVLISSSYHSTHVYRVWLRVLCILLWSAGNFKVNKLQKWKKLETLACSACSQSDLHYCRSQALAWSCWTSCFLWGHFLYQHCTASCHSYCRHHGQPSEEKKKSLWTTKRV